MSTMTRAECYALMAIENEDRIDNGMVTTMILKLMREHSAWFDNQELDNDTTAVQLTEAGTAALRDKLLEDGDMRSLYAHVSGQALSYYPSKTQNIQTDNMNCGQGICGTCKATYVAGDYDYHTEILASVNEGEVVTCCASSNSGLLLAG